MKLKLMAWELGQALNIICKYSIKLKVFLSKDNNKLKFSRDLNISLPLIMNSLKILNWNLDYQFKKRYFRMIKSLIDCFRLKK